MKGGSLIYVNTFLNTLSFKKVLKKSPVEAYYFPDYKNNESSHSQLTKFF